MGSLALGISGTSYYDWSRRGRLYVAYATITAPVIWSTAAATGGPLLWNNSLATGTQAVDAVLLAVGVAITTASAAGSGLGITGATGQTAAPSSTTAIDASGCTNIGGGLSSQCNVYRKGTVTNAGTFFMPTHSLDTAALTATPLAAQWVDLAGSIIVTPGSWASVAASATATTAACDIGLLWCEIPR